MIKMNDDKLKKVIDELHIYEKKVLKSLESFNYESSPEDISKAIDMDIKSVMSAAGSMASKDIIEVEKDVQEFAGLTDIGLDYSKNGLPEKQLLKALDKYGTISMDEMPEKSGMENVDVKIAIGWLLRKRWASVDKGNVTITDEGKTALTKRDSDEELIDTLTQGKVNLQDLGGDLKKSLKNLKKRKNIIKIDKKTSHTLKVLDKGMKLLDIGIEIREEATQLTHEQLKTGAWKSLHYRGYDINAEHPETFPGKMHPLQRIIEEIRAIFLNMGFTESGGNILESAFWNFDCLFQPQDHAAREMQDTFYVKNPRYAELPREELVKKVGAVHENGGSTGSLGWKYPWNREIARQTVLRTHTTCLSTRFLDENKPPLKMFSVGRVFRRETITYKHLPEFHQVEGIVAGEDITFKNLLGILKEFYKKLGFEVRFRPAYFPYTYLSTECEIYLPEKESWIELGGSGMFRPEVLEPLGIDVPVLAFGLGIERLAMIRYGISDIRMLYKSDIGWLRRLPVVQGVKTD